MVGHLPKNNNLNVNISGRTYTREPLPTYTSRTQRHILLPRSSQPTTSTASISKHSSEAATMSSLPNRPEKQKSHRWIWFIAGPTACGKTTIAKYLAERLGFTFVEGDDVRLLPPSTLAHLIPHHLSSDRVKCIYADPASQYHPKANLEKMSHNQPLSDADRQAWLQALREHETAQPPANAPSPHLVVTCSALKRQYRDVLREGGEHAGDLRVRFVFLSVPEDLLRERARERKGHFAGEGLIKSQMEALEPPAEEERDVVVVQVGRDKGVEETEGEVLTRVREEMGI
ncbi:hypothetical protein VTI74DRAFT_9358 [Chaetomium olivicolor]